MISMVSRRAVNFYRTTMITNYEFCAFGNSKNDQVFNSALAEESFVFQSASADGSFFRNYVSFKNGNCCRMVIKSV
jgi:hypothetical protein